MKQPTLQEILADLNRMIEERQLRDLLNKDNLTKEEEKHRDELITKLM